MFERMFAARWLGVSSVRAAVVFVALVALIAVGAPVEAADRSMRVRIADRDGDVATLELWGESADSLAGARMHLVGFQGRLEVTRVSEREMRARHVATLPYGLYVLNIQKAASAEPARVVEVSIGPVGPIVQDN